MYKYEIINMNVNKYIYIHITHEKYINTKIYIYTHSCTVGMMLEMMNKMKMNMDMQMMNMKRAMMKKNKKMRKKRMMNGYYEER